MLPSQNRPLLFNANIQTLSCLYVFVLFAMIQNVQPQACSGQELNAAQLREAMRSERSKLINGKFVAKGTTTVENSNNNDLPQSDSSWKYEFDLSRKVFIFDREQSIRPNEKLRGSLNDRHRVLFARDSHTTFGFQDLTSNILFIEENTSVEKTLGGHYTNINVYGFGFLNLDPLIDSLNEGDNAFFARIRPGTPIEEIEVKKISDTVFELSFTTLANTKRILQIDASKGYAPIRHTSMMGDSISFDNLTDWEKFGDVWVPTVLTGEEYTPYIPDGMESKVENLITMVRKTRYEFDWINVNNSPQPETIDYKVFSLPPGTSAFKNNENVYIFGATNQPKPAPTDEPKESRNPFFLFATIAIIITSLLIFWSRIQYAKAK